MVTLAWVSRVSRSAMRRHSVGRTLRVTSSSSTRDLAAHSINRSIKTRSLGLPAKVWIEHLASSLMPFAWTTSCRHLSSGPSSEFTCFPSWRARSHPARSDVGKNLALTSITTTSTRRERQTSSSGSASSSNVTGGFAGSASISACPSVRPCAIARGRGAGRRATLRP
jgi:hypothetical protein